MSQDIEINESIKVGANQAVIKANAMVVVDNQTNSVATDFIKVIKRFQDEIKAELRPAIEKAYELHRHLTSQEKRLLAPLQEAEKAIKTKVGNFLAAEEAKRQEEQRKVTAIAEAAERKRKEALEAQAKAHEAAGRTEKAEERRQLAAETFVPAPIIESKVQKQEGVAAVQTWKFEVVDEMLIPREYLVVDEPGIGKIVRAFKNKEKVEKMIPGIRVWAETDVRVRV